MLSPKMMGIVSMVGGIVMVSLQDAMVKLFAGSYALHEVMLVRATVALSLTLVILQMSGGLQQLYSSSFSLLVLRGLMLVVANTCFFLAMVKMPVAEVVAIFFIAPVLITALSAILLKESVGLARWSSVAIGMVGVVIMLRPGTEAIRWEGLLAIGAAFAYCCMQLLTRHMHTTASTATMVAYAQISLLMASAVMGMLTGWGQFSDVDDPSLQFLLRSWTLPAESDLVLWVLMGAVSAAGTFLVTRGYRLASASVIAPFEYVAMPCAVVWGLMLYSEAPDRVAVIGIMLIIGSGLYVMRRESS